jgi:hypothetical protein
MEEVANSGKEGVKLHVPYSLRFGLIWTLFFMIVGILMVYFSRDMASIGDIFKTFFTSDYIAWFKSFGSFSNVTVYPTTTDFIFALLGKWYYFFITGGFLSIIWGLLSWIINLEFIFKKKEKIALAPQVVQAPPRIQEEVRTDIPPIPEQKPTFSSNPGELDSWLDEGFRLLAEKNLEEAELIYEQARRAYNPQADSNQKLYKRLLDFYTEIVAERDSGN